MNHGGNVYRPGPLYAGFRGFVPVDFGPWPSATFLVHGNSVPAGSQSYYIVRVVVQPVRADLGGPSR